MLTHSTALTVKALSTLSGNKKRKKKKKKERPSCSCPVLSSQNYRPKHTIKKMPLLSVLYCEFDNIAGPKIVYQYPDGLHMAFLFIFFVYDCGSVLVYHRESVGVLV